MLSGPEMMSSFRLLGLPNAMQGAGEGCSASLLCQGNWRDTFNPLHFKQLQAKKKCRGNIQTWADNNPALYIPLINP